MVAQGSVVGELREHGKLLQMASDFFLGENTLKVIVVITA